MSYDEVQALKNELTSVKEKNNHLFQQNVLPKKEEKKQEFLDVFEEFFREKGFVVQKKTDSVRASFDTLNFKAFFNENGELIIMNGRDPIASILIRFNGEKHSITNFNESVIQLKKELENENILSIKLENPMFYYTGANSDIRFDSPLSVLNSIFQL
ncbi:MAG: hypothetical protein Q8934_12765 [Bacillota bacterium]|nr:hypothetical protein [Bacillota bacterium]